MPVPSPQAVPRRTPRLLPCVALLALLCPPAPALAPRQDPPLRLPLGSLGYLAPQPRYLLAGGTMFTVNFVDPTHLLVTWSARGLLRRLADAQPNDQDRNIEALVLDLPTGNVLARTTWRARDHARYLWPLGQGRFLLRLRNELSILQPLAHLTDGHTFDASTVLRSQRTIGFVFVSPDSEVVTVESFAPLPAAVPGAPDRLPDYQHSPVQINFYRVMQDTARVFLQAAGIVRADNGVSLPLTGAGYLEAIKESPRAYDFDFVPFTGPRMELAAFDTTCYPHVTFLSRSEFVSFGCRGSDDKQQVGFFNLRGEHPWLATFSTPHINPVVVSAPDTGRFALGRTIVNSAGLDPFNLVDAEVSGQEITVYQSHDGRQLLRLMATPVQRAGQNFDIAPDGLSFALFRNDTIEVYRLPPLSNKDRQQVLASSKLSPPDAPGPVHVTAQDATADATAEAESDSTPAAPSPVAPLPPTQTNNTVGDAVIDPEAPRKRPSLYSPDYPAAPSPSQAPSDSDHTAPHL